MQPHDRASFANPLNGWRHVLWLGVLVAASVLVSRAFACATPFAAFAVLATLTLSRRDGLYLMLAVWLANQFVGYTFLDYPYTAESFAWGAGLGVAVLLTWLAARWVLLHIGAAVNMYVRMAILLAASFAVYEALLLAFALVLGGTENFTGDIVGHLFSTNGLALIGLYGLHQLGAAVGLQPSGKLA